MSLPAWGCGLKSICNDKRITTRTVTPCVGVWIEMIVAESNRAKTVGHSLRGGVD